MIDRLISLWPHLQQQPVFWLLATVAVFESAQRLARRWGGHPLLNPVGMSILVLVLALLLTGTHYDIFMNGAQWLHLLLGPATVALALPLYQQRERIRALLMPLGLTLMGGSLLAILSSVGIAALLGASKASLLSLAPKSATAPVAMGIVEKLGGIPSLTAAVVILTGITGAMTAPLLLDGLRVRTPAARGFAMGLVSHGIGTARAMQESPETGAFAGLGMGLNALLTAILVPILYRWLIG